MNHSKRQNKAFRIIEGVLRLVTPLLLIWSGFYLAFSHPDAPFFSKVLVIMPGLIFGGIATFGLWVPMWRNFTKKDSN
jgi:hypothetical protein